MENKRYRRRLGIGALVIIGLGVLVLCGAGLLFVYRRNASAAQIIESSLTSIDQRFTRQRDSSLITESGSVEFPVQVGAFQRSRVSDCGYAISPPNSCKSTVYTIRDQPNSQIYVTARRVSGIPAESLRDTSARGDCGPENGGENHLRTVGSQQYRYTLCFLSLLESTGSLSAITWVDRDWLISIGVCFCGENNFNQLAAQFIVDYP